MKTARTVLMVMLFTGLMSATMSGQVEFGVYEFAGSSTGDNQFNEVTSQPAFGTFSAFTRTNVTWNSGADFFNSKDWNMGTSRDDNEFVGFSLTLLGSNTYRDATLTLTFNTQRSSTGPTIGEIMYRFDDNLFGSAGTWSPPTTSTSTVITVPAPGNTTSTFLEVRFHAWGASSSAGTLRFDNVALLGDDVPLPIQLASITASVLRGRDVEVQWRTISETNNFGFEIDRMRGNRGPWTTLGFVEGHGTTLAPQSYSYLDRSVAFGKYRYRVRQIDLDGKSETFPEMEVNVGLEPGKFVLAQNYPNPFNPSTTIEFIVPQAGWVTLKVYNLLGQEVETLQDGNVEANKVNEKEFNAEGLASGLYYYQLRGARTILTKRMLLLR
jgi:hypothetical protein